jgi:hypothetical protein
MFPICPNSPISRPESPSSAIRAQEDNEFASYIKGGRGPWAPRSIFISGDPVFGDLLLCGSNIKLSSTDHVAQPSLQPIFGFGVPFRLYVAPHLRPEVGRVIATAQAQRYQVVDLIAWMRARRQPISHQYLVTTRCIHRASMLLGMSACRQSIMTVYPHRATSQVRVRPDFDCRCRRHNGKQCGGYEPDYHRWHHWSFFMGWFFQSALPMRQSLQVTFALALPASS